jgi:hypothetical protein
MDIKYFDWIRYYRGEGNHWDLFRHCFKNKILNNISLWTFGQCAKWVQTVKWEGDERTDPVCYTCLYETGFSAVTAIKSNYRPEVNVEREMKVAIWPMRPRFRKLCKCKQAHPSH